jgi:hypothetical protein
MVIWQTEFWREKKKNNQKAQFNLCVVINVLLARHDDEKNKKELWQDQAKQNKQC